MTWHDIPDWFIVLLVIIGLFIFLYLISNARRLARIKEETEFLKAEIENTAAVKEKEFVVAADKPVDIAREDLATRTRDLAANDAYAARLSIDTEQYGERKAIDVNSQLKLERGQADVRVGEKKDTAHVALEAARRKNLQEFQVIVAKMEYLFAAYDDLEKLNTSDDPAKEQKLAALRKQIEWLERDFYGRLGRAGQDAVPKPDEREVGGLAQAAAGPGLDDPPDD